MIEYINTFNAEVGEECMRPPPKPVKATAIHMSEKEMGDGASLWCSSAHVLYFHTWSHNHLLSCFIMGPGKPYRMSIFWPFEGPDGPGPGWKRQLSFFSKGRETASIPHLQSLSANGNRSSGCAVQAPGICWSSWKSSWIAVPVGAAPGGLRLRGSVVSEDVRLLAFCQSV